MVPYGTIFGPKKPHFGMSKSVKPAKHAPFVKNIFAKLKSHNFLARFFKKMGRNVWLTPMALKQMTTPTFSVRIIKSYETGGSILC